MSGSLGFDVFVVAFVILIVITIALGVRTVPQGWAYTVERFGPVRSVRAEPGHGLVLEVAFEGLNRSTRHRSGLAMRFPRISRIRTDKPANEADTVATLLSLVT